jgi:hypothetical protein
VLFRLDTCCNLVGMRIFRFLLIALTGIAAQAGYVVSTVVGGGPGAGEAATSASLNIQGLAMDSAGNIYFSFYSRVYKVDNSSGILSVVAGKYFTKTNSQPSGDGGSAVDAVVGQAGAIALDSAGNIFFTDIVSVRRVDAKTGVITSFVAPGNGNGSSPIDMAFDSHGNLQYAYAGDDGIGVDPTTGNVYMGTHDGLGNHWTYEVAPNPGLILTGHAVFRFDAAGNGYEADYAGDQILKFSPGFQSYTAAAGTGFAGFSGDGGPATAAQLWRPYFLAVGPNGDFAVWDQANARIRKVVSGIISTAAGNGVVNGNTGGDGGPATSAQIDSLYIAADGAGNIYISDYYRIRKVDAATQIITTIAGNGKSGPKAPDGTPALQASINNDAGGIAVDGSGTVYFTDAGGVSVRKISAGILGTVTGVESGGPMVTDAGGNLYVASGYTDHYLTRIASGNGAATILAGGLSSAPNPVSGLVTALTTDSTFVYFVDSGTGQIKKVPLAGGTETVVAGGFSGATGLMVDVDGSLVVTNGSQGPIQRVTLSPTISVSTIGGTGALGFNGDGLPVSVTQFYSTASPVALPGSRIAVLDVNNGRIRALTPSSAIAVTVATNPVGLQVSVDGNSVTGPQVYGWIPGSLHTIAAASTQLDANNATWAFSSWSDGGVASHSVTAPSIDITYSALFSKLFAQNITFGALGNVAFGAAPFTLSATASSGLTVTFSSTTPGVCTESGSTVTILAAGTCSIAASQAGNSTYAAAPTVTRSFTVQQGIQLTTAVSPANSGAITISPASSGNYYASGSTVCLTATPAAGQIFVNWTGTALNAANCLTMSTNASVTATFTANPVSAASALRFVPSTLCRLVDTRNTIGPLGGPAIGGGAARSFTIRGACGLPSTALAYSLNLTVVPHGTLGYVTLWPTGQLQPVVSTLNSIDGRVKSNASIVPAGSGGAVSVFATNSTDVILDINGYFDSYTDASALQFYPLTPCRVADTRSGAGALGGPALVASQSRSFPVISGACNIPPNALAYSLNFTAIPLGPLGYLTVWPSGQSQPLVSTLNAPTGTVTANAAIVPAGAGGAIQLFATNNSDMAIDINGYFAAPASGGLSLYNLTPCRMEDTRLPAGTPAFTGTVAETATGATCGIPPEARSLVLNATVVPSGSLGYLSLWANGGSQPVVSTLNSLDGSVTSNMAFVPTANGLVNAYAAGPGTTHLILDISGYFAP